MIFELDVKFLCCFEQRKRQKNGSLAIVYAVFVVCCVFFGCVFLFGSCLVFVWFYSLSLSVFVFRSTILLVNRELELRIYLLYYCLWCKSFITEIPLEFSGGSIDEHPWYSIFNGLLWCCCTSTWLWMVFLFCRNQSTHFTFYFSFFGCATLSPSLSLSHGWSHVCPILLTTLRLLFVIYSKHEQTFCDCDNFSRFSFHFWLKEFMLCAEFSMLYSVLSLTSICCARIRSG